jgi:glycosyltransferase involved in cell wall biosynthesis
MRDPAPWRVSAIVPSYNRADLLPQTLDQLLGQTSPPDEVIVVDDGSTDDTAAAAARFGARVRYARIENSGAPVARNVGAALATGDWLWFCDSDDLWRPQYLDRCRAVAETAPYPQFIFGDFRLVREGVWDPGGKFATAPAEFWAALPRIAAPGGAILTTPLVGALLDFQPIFHSTIMMTRSFFDHVGRYDGRFARTGSEDFEFILRCVAQAPIGVVEEPLVGIRRHPGNFSGDHRRSLLGEVDILEHARARHPAAAAHLARIDAEIVRRTLGALALAFADDDFSAVRTLARRLDPAAIDLVSRLKILLAALPAPLRAPAVAAGRLPGVLRSAAR